MPRESTIQRAIKDWINETFGSRAQVRVLHGSGMSVRGDPDIYACIDGAMILIETKQPGERARALQAARLRQWARAGAVAIKADSLDYVKSVLFDLGFLDDQGTVDGMLFIDGQKGIPDEQPHV